MKQTDSSSIIKNAIIPFWKPKNIYSNDIVRFISKTYNVKVGHAGTLDPFAEGVLVVCTGSETKKASLIQLKPKTYLARIKLGEETDTLDSDGEVIRKKNIQKLDIDTIKNTIKKFKGEIDQRPPAFSALRKNNVRRYTLARKDIYLILKARKIKILSIKLISFKSPYINLEIKCGKGTYIRALARDIGKALNTYGYLYSLKRLNIGSFDKKECDKFKHLINEDL